MNASDVPKRDSHSITKANVFDAVFTIKQPNLKHLDGLQRLSKSIEIVHAHDIRGFASSVAKLGAAAMRHGIDRLEPPLTRPLA